MDEPMNFATVEDGIVTNVIWLCASNRADFPNSVCVANRAVTIGDRYEEGVFLRDGVIVPTYAEQIAELGSRVIELEDTVSTIEEALNE